MFPNSRKWCATYPKCVIYARLDTDIDNPCYTITVVSNIDEERAAIHCCEGYAPAYHHNGGMSGFCLIQHNIYRDRKPRHDCIASFARVHGLLSQHDRDWLSIWFVTCGRPAAFHIRSLVRVMEHDFSQSKLRPLCGGLAYSDHIWESDSPFIRAGGLHPDEAIAIMDSVLVGDSALVGSTADPDSICAD